MRYTGEDPGVNDQLRWLIGATAYMPPSIIIIIRYPFTLLVYFHINALFLTTPLFFIRVPF